MNKKKSRGILQFSPKGFSDGLVNKIEGLCLIANPIETSKLAVCMSDTVPVNLFSLKEEQKGRKEKMTISNLMILKRDRSLQNCQQGLACQRKRD